MIFGRGKVRYNNPYTMKDVEGFSYLTTRIKYPAWIDERILSEGLDNLDIPSVSEFIINKMSDVFSLEGLLKSKWFPDLPISIDVKDIIPEIRSRIPSDGTEITDWMHDSSADNAILQAFEDEYNKYSEIRTGSNDPASPGLVVVNTRFYGGQPGYTVNSRGYALGRAPIGEFRAPNRRGTILIGENYIGWAGVNAWGGYQWTGKLAQWIRLAATPITSRIRFPNLGFGPMPNFFVQMPRGATERVTVTMAVSSSTSQNISIAFRDPNNYSRVLDEAVINVGAGQFEIVYTIASYPAVPPVVVEAAPRVNTVLDRFVVE